MTVDDQTHSQQRAAADAELHELPIALGPMTALHLLPACLPRGTAKPVWFL